jgi:hypothetical protein
MFFWHLQMIHWSRPWPQSIGRSASPLARVVGEFTEEEDDVYLEVRDADGRLLACRIDYEDQLDRSRLTDSMFNTEPRPKIPM